MSLPKCWPKNAEELARDGFSAEDGWVTMYDDDEFWDTIDDLNEQLAGFGAKIEAFSPDDVVVMRVVKIGGKDA